MALYRRCDLDYDLKARAASGIRIQLQRRGRFRQKMRQSCIRYVPWLLRQLAAQVDEADENEEAHERCDLLQISWRRRA